MSRLRFLGIWALLLVSASGGASQGAPASERRTGHVFRVEVPPVSVVADADGSSRVTIPGFRERQVRPGAPDVNGTSYRVAIPDGVTPRLEVRVQSEEILPRVRPRPVPKLEFDVESETESRRIERRVPDDAIYKARRPWPDTIARLGEIGTFRDQRYVVVHVAPVRFDPTVGGLRIARGVEVEVHFDGDDGRRTAPATDERLESAYRTLFVNYAEGRTFRLQASSDAGSSVEPLVGPVYKIKVRQNTVVRLDNARMTGTPFLAEQLSSWKLTNRGVEVPLDVRDANLNGTLDPGDYVQFWGQALDDEPKSVLQTDIPGTDIDLFEARDFTDENVYFLSVEAGPRARMSPRAVAPTNVRTPPSNFEAIARAETDNAWRPLGGNDPWYWSPALASNGTTLRTDAVLLPGLASTTLPIRVITPVRGITESITLSPDHHTRVTLLNQSAQVLATNDDLGTFDGRTVYTHDFTWPGSPGVSSASVQVRLEARPISVGSHQVMLDRIEVRYRRLFQAAGDTLTFDWPDGDSEFIVSGLSSNAPDVWELTGRVGTTGVVQPVRMTGATVTGAGPFTIRFRVDDDPALPNGTPRRFVVAGPSAVLVPAGADFASDPVSDLRSTSNQADLIVIAHPGVLGGSCQPVLDQLLAWKSSQQGISSKRAWIEDVNDEFGDGLPGPGSIRRFLQWVMSTAPGQGWANPKPSYVLLLGDASFDYKAGTTNGTYVPTQIMFKDDPAFGYYASESSLAAVVGNDAMPDLAVGRLPVRSDAECTSLVQKLLSYQQSPPAGTWTRNALAVSDRGKDFSEFEALQFEETNADALAWMKQPPHTSQHLRYWSDYCGGSAAGCTFAKSNLMRADIKEVINGAGGAADGAAVVQFTGHGNFDVWSDDAFLDNRSPAFDIDDLVNGGRLPAMFVHNCLTAGFMSTATRTLGEDWLKKTGGGGISVFAPSGLSNGYFGVEASEEIWRDLFGPPKERELAAPVMDVYANLCGFGAIEPCQNYVLLGDPTTRLAIRTVAPPTGVSAVPGNARVDLSWTASATPGARYDVWRAQDAPTNTYVRANGGTPILGTTFADLGLTNTKTYYYAVVALDAENFESRWSHLNTDCPVDGPDCLDARPLNPNAPAAVTGVSIVDPETGGKLFVSWNASPEVDLKHYEVRFGTQSGGPYPNVVNAAKLTSTAVSGLTNGQTYYFVVTATNTSDLTSLPSPQIAAVPTFVRGLRAPQVVSGLVIAKSGLNAILSWPAVTVDIYGKATTIVRYEIYRGTTPTFVPGPGNKIGETATTSFQHTGALGVGTTNGHYLVRAVSSLGNAGGLGNQLPNGIGILQINKAAPNVVLSWPAVTTDFDGRSLVIDHYEIYARATSFDAEAVRDGQVPMIGSTTGTSFPTLPPAGRQFYTVLAVDRRGNKSPF
jgi:peptidase C25-like protein/fibronectin type III domain protein